MGYCRMDGGTIFGCMFTVLLPPPCTFTQNGASPLYAASQEGHTEVVDTLLENGVDPNLATTVCTLLWCVHCPTPGSADRT